MANCFSSAGVQDATWEGGIRHWASGLLTKVG